MHNGWNPNRRNRNIGTAKQGHGQNNHQTVPTGFPQDRIFYEHIVNAIVVLRTILHHNMTFLVEPTQLGCIHACTVDDICHILQFLPAEHVEGIDVIILRQPTRRQAMLCPVWGRFVYYSGIGKYSGPAIYLEAQDLKERWRWDTSMSPDEQKELTRLYKDGHQITQTKRYYEIASTLEAIRCTQLYRTLLHEFGHYVDWLTHSLIPSTETNDPDECGHIRERFDSKPAREREAFAHKYADTIREKLTSQGNMPFDRIFNHQKMTQESINPQWFSEE